MRAFKKISGVIFLSAMVYMMSCNQRGRESSETNHNDKAMIRLITLDPGHFHAALVQKENYPEIDTNVYVYAPNGPDLDAHLNLINQYNSRPENPTHWNEIVYTGNDFADKMFRDKKGNVVVLSGNNRLKTDYILRSVKDGMNVLADKPMAINSDNFRKLKEAFEEADKQNVLLYDIMTERFEITNILQKELVNNKDVFGDFKKGSPDDPSVIFESIHYFFKNVSGRPLIRPAWFFDPNQQGDAIVDVGTHLVDLAQWECFPDEILDYQKDVEITGAKIWPTPLTPSQFKSVTGMDSYPGYLKPYISKDSILETHGNGQMDYTLKGVPVRIIAKWDYKAIEGGDALHTVFKGTKSTVEIRQGKPENFKPVLYIIPAEKKDFDSVIQKAVEGLNERHSGLTAEKLENGEWKLIIPEKYDVGHEAHFGQVMQHYLKFLKDKKMPVWEVPDMLTKYYITTKSLEIATGNK